MPNGTVKVDGCELTYVREGNGPSIFVIGSAIHYQKAFSHRLRQHFDLIFADARHVVPSYAPASDALQRLTLETFADDVEAMRQHVGVDRMAVLGHSVHAQIAIAYARKYAHRTSHLILIGGVPYAFAEFSEEAARFWQENASPERKAILDTNAKDWMPALLLHLPRGASRWPIARADLCTGPIQRTMRLRSLRDLRTAQDSTGSSHWFHRVLKFGDHLSK